MQIVRRHAPTSPYFQPIAYREIDKHTSLQRGRHALVDSVGQMIRLRRAGDGRHGGLGPAKQTGQAGRPRQYNGQADLTLGRVLPCAMERESRDKGVICTLAPSRPLVGSGSRHDPYESECCMPDARSDCFEEQSQGRARWVLHAMRQQHGRLQPPPTQTRGTLAKAAGSLLPRVVLRQVWLFERWRTLKHSRAFRLKQRGVRMVLALGSPCCSMLSVRMNGAIFIKFVGGLRRRRTSGHARSFRSSVFGFARTGDGTFD